MLKSDPSSDYLLYGDVSSVEYQSAKFILERNCINASISGMLSSEFQRLKNDLVKLHPKVPFHHFTRDFILMKGNIISDLNDLKIKAEFDSTDLQRSASENLYKVLKETNNPIVELEMKINNVIQDKIIMQLFDNLTPKTVSKFLDLVKGKNSISYSNSKVCRVLADGWIQVGEIRDKNGTIIKDAVFEDENFILHHDSPGVLSMVNSGPHSNFSKFMIGCRPMPYFDYKYVAFGKVVYGQQIIDKISRLKNSFEKPTVDVLINSIKQLEF